MDERREQTETRERIAEQLCCYARLRPSFKAYAEALEKILGKAVEALAPTALVKGRAKSVSSFAEKLLRKHYADPLQQMTDLCGVRVIVRTRAEVETVGRFLEQNFDIAWEHSLDTSRRLQPAEFGYRSVHYIVQPFRDRPYSSSLAAEFFDWKAEIQVRTMAEHAWADFAHDLSYKGAFSIPPDWQRELATLAAQLEDTDQGFARLEDRLRSYATSYGRLLSEKEAEREMQRLEALLQLAGPEGWGADAAARLGKLAIVREDWQGAIDAMSPFVHPQDEASTPHDLLRDLGVALCKLHKKHRARPPSRAEFERGQRYLELATQQDPENPDAFSSLAGTWKDIDDGKAHGLYRRAAELDPGDPYAVGNCVEFELVEDPERLGMTRLLVIPAIQRCRDHIEVGINLPWALYDLGKFHLLREEPYASLDAYAKALDASQAAWMVETSRASLDRLVRVGERLSGYRWIRRFLELALLARVSHAERSSEVFAKLKGEAEPIQGPVVILAGGTDPRVQERIGRYAKSIREAFAAFRGTVIGGGTSQGVSGLVGELAAAHPDIRAIGYLPREMPADATPDPRYHELRQSEGEQFSPLEPLQAWTDLVLSKLDPSDVRVVGINGGSISAAEYRIALALGARVGILADSGREAGRITADPWWGESERLVVLPDDVQSLRAFLWSGRSNIPEAACEDIATLIHDAYRESRRHEQEKSDDAMAEWVDLRDDLKRSNRAQARHIEEKLRALGLEIEQAPGASPKPLKLSPEQVEQLAEMEHGRWVAERLLAGWRWGEERDHQRKRNPFLVPWRNLPEQIRERDRETVRRIPEYLRKTRLMVRPR